MSLGTWFRDRPGGLEKIYRGSLWVFRKLKPLIHRFGYNRAEQFMVRVEYLTKGLIFDCQLCGQCTLHTTGMTCPMTCPKNLRNGPCGGVTMDGCCEVKPEMKCVWVEAYERSHKMAVYGSDILHIQPPLNHQLKNTSAWINEIKGFSVLPGDITPIFIQPTLTKPDEPH